MTATLVRPYALPSVDEFAQTDRVVDVIVGTVTSSDPVVEEDSGSVSTILTIAVERRRASNGSKTVKAKEAGGVVTMGDVRSDFESKTGEKLSEAELDQTVDFQFEKVRHAKVGERVLVILVNDPQSENYIGAARMSAVDTDTFVWPGEPLNPNWEKEVQGSQLLGR